MGARGFEFRDKAIRFRSYHATFGADCLPLSSGFGSQYLEFVMSELDLRASVLDVRSCGIELMKQSIALVIELRLPCH